MITEVYTLKAFCKKNCLDEDDFRDTLTKAAKYQKVPSINGYSFFGLRKKGWFAFPINNPIRLIGADQEIYNSEILENPWLEKELGTGTPTHTPTGQGVSTPTGQGVSQGMKSEVQAPVQAEDLSDPNYNPDF